MPWDPLEQLLRQADATAPATPLLAALPARVRRRHVLRRRSRGAVAGIAVVMLPLLAMAWFNHRSPPPPQPSPVVRADTPPPPAPPTTPPAPQPNRTALAQLEVVAALHEQTAARLIALSGRGSRGVPSAAAKASAMENPVSSDLREQRDRAALVLVYEADRAVREKRSDYALAAYRRTIELFPTSYWADVARRRLKEMPT